MDATRRSKVHRRSLLVVGASVVATLSLPRGSHGAVADAVGHASDLARSRSSTSRLSTRNVLDLKTVGPTQQVTSIEHAGDTYRITTASGATFSFPEFNLRIKTDSSPRGPAKGRPVLLSASMRNDRAFVIFANPGEISAFIGKSADQS